MYMINSNKLFFSYLTIYILMICFRYLIVDMPKIQYSKVNNNCRNESLFTACTIFSLMAGLVAVISMVVCITFPEGNKYDTNLFGISLLTAGCFYSGIKNLFIQPKIYNCECFLSKQGYEIVMKRYRVVSYIYFAMTLLFIMGMYYCV